jgi:hypothetical protein
MSNSQKRGNGSITPLFLKQRRMEKHEEKYCPPGEYRLHDGNYGISIYEPEYLPAL